MFRGITIFKCTKCGKRFIAPDIEYMATAYSVPQPCPRCGSIRTRPAGLFPFTLINNLNYKCIWERMEKDMKKRCINYES